MIEKLFRLPARLYVLFAILHACGITALSSIPGNDLPGTGFFARMFFNLAHAPMFALFAAWIALAQLDRGSVLKLRNRSGVITVAIVMGFALLDEYHQSFVKLRSSDPIDLVTDFAGACAAVFFIRVLLAPAATRGRDVRVVLACVALALTSAGFASR